MNDYKELIDILNDVDFADCCEHCFLPCSGSGDCFVLKAADAIEQLVRERDAAVENIQNISLGIIPSPVLKKHHEIHFSYTSNKRVYVAVETFNSDADFPRTQQDAFDELSFAITKLLKRCFKI